MTTTQGVAPSATADVESKDTITPRFEDLGLTDLVLKGVADAGFTLPSPIQAVAIPTILSGQDIIGQAQTGSGKTGAFVMPALQTLLSNKTVEVLVLVPTRELAMQVVTEFERLGKYHRLSVATVVGGQPSMRQIEMVNRGAQVVVATPGRLLDHLQSGRLKNFTPRLVVLDEADEMLDMGFIDDIKSILKFIPNKRQTLLFSATMPGPIAKLAREELTDPHHIKLNQGAEQHADIEQQLYVVKDSDKELALMRLIDAESPHKAIVFCRTRRETDDLCRNLVQGGIKATALHGDLGQHERNRAIDEIKNGVAHVLVATDVASRGLDISDLSHVFNFHTPENRDRYTHRIGRTGRAGNKGVAITIATPYELQSNAFYSRKPGLNFTVSNVPSRKDLEVKHSTQLIETIKQTYVSPEIQAICEELLSKEDAFEMLCKFYAHMQAGKKIQGPERLGLSPDEVSRLSSRPARGRGGPSRGGRFGSRPPRQGGGYRASDDSRSSGSRPSEDRRPAGGRSSDRRPSSRPTTGPAKSRAPAAARPKRDRPAR